LVHSRAVRKPLVAIILSILKCTLHITWSEKLDWTSAEGNILSPHHLPAYAPVISFMLMLPNSAMKTFPWLLWLAKNKYLIVLKKLHREVIMQIQQ